MDIIDECENPERAIFWVVDIVGGCGKSFLSQKLIGDKHAFVARQFCVQGQRISIPGGTMGCV